jgi:hypothetical protein
MRARTRPSAALILLAVALTMLLGASTDAHATGWWRLASRTAPSYLAHGGRGTIVISATNVGDSSILASSTPVTVKAELPTELQATEIKGAPAFELVEEGHQMSCQLATLTCVSQPEAFVPFQALIVSVQVQVASGAASGEQVRASVSGGQQEGGAGVGGASAAAPITVNDEPTPFGVEPEGYSIAPEEEGGGADLRAGSHPFQLTTTLDLNETTEDVAGQLVPSAPALPRELDFDLPPGLIGDPEAVPTCATVDFLAISTGDTNLCNAASAIGVAVVTIDEPAHFHYVTRSVPLWNLEPAQGEPARFGFEVLKVPVVLDTSLREGGDYGVTVSVTNAPQAAQILSSEVTIWGAPGAVSHDPARGWACLLGGAYFNGEQPCDPPAPRPEEAFLTLPTSCTGTIGTTVEGSSWPVDVLAGETGPSASLEGANTRFDLTGGLEGCAATPFDPSIELSPESDQASTPTGLKVDVHIPQSSTLQADGTAESDLRDTTVTLPPGVEINPSSANGLQACSEAQIGYEGPGATDPLSPGAAEPLRFSTVAASCPEASKVGTVRVHTPLLEHELTGSVYLAAQDANPFGSLIALYIVAEDPYSGIRVKLAGEVQLNPSTGQIISTFDNAPQVPFEDFELEFFGGPRASVSTPAHCGSPTSEALFTPWSQGEAKLASSAPGEFAIGSGPGGSACASPLPFAPTTHAGSSDTQAGAFASYSLTVENPDGSQPLRELTIHLPDGIAALISTVTPCPEPPAGQEWSCGPDSEIGHSLAASGIGSEPYQLRGTVYLTTGYDGAPFGILVVTPAVAGPFDLGNVDVHSRIQVNPSSAAVTLTTDPFPQFVDGVPVDLKTIAATIDRPGFAFNPTSCEPATIDTTLTGNEGTTVERANHFQASGCSTLPFHPKLTARTTGHASKPDGTSFTVEVTSAGLGQENVKKVDLQLPKQLPSRQSTLKEACPDTIFDANPSGCESAPYEHSVVGYATVHTPVLKSPLSGPAILVSHASAAFPDLEFVLQGEGIELVLDGHTDIKSGVTYSRFESAPDAPFTSFETVLPAGQYSILGAYAGEANPEELCPDKLVMPTTITSQAGTTITSTTPVSTTGCGAVKGYKAKKPTKAQQLAAALKSCRRQYARRAAKRANCERKARASYRSRSARAKRR